jgi:hypothetical protein
LFSKKALHDDMQSFFILRTAGILTADISVEIRLQQ